MKNKEILERLLIDVAKIVCKKEKLEDLNARSYDKIAKETGNKFTAKSFKNWCTWCTSYPFDHNLHILSHFVLNKWNEKGQIEDEKLKKLLDEINEDEIDVIPFFDKYVELTKEDEAKEIKEVIKEKEVRIEVVKKVEVPVEVVKTIEVPVEVEKEKNPLTLLLLFTASLGIFGMGYFSSSLFNDTEIVDKSNDAEKNRNIDTLFLKKFEKVWVGKLDQEIVKNGIEQLPRNIRLTFESNLDSIQGLLEFMDVDTTKEDYVKYFILKGDLVDNDFINIEYRCKGLDCKSFGSIILKINSLRNEMYGKLIGYGSTQENLIKGDIYLSKN